MTPKSEINQYNNHFDLRFITGMPKLKEIMLLYVAHVKILQYAWNLNILMVYFPYIFILRNSIRSLWHESVTLDRAQWSKRINTVTQFIPTLRLGLVWLGTDILSVLSVADELKKMPAPEVAVKYYTGGDLYLFGKFLLPLPLKEKENTWDLESFYLWFSVFEIGYLQFSIIFCPDEFQTSRVPNTRRPKIGNAVVWFDSLSMVQIATCSMEN